MHIKEKAILNYKYSLLSRPEQFVHAIKGLNIYRSYYTGDVRYYEAFWIIHEPKEFNEIIEWCTFGVGNDRSPVVPVIRPSCGKGRLLQQGNLLRKIYDLITNKVKNKVKNNE